MLRIYYYPPVAILIESQPDRYRFTRLAPLYENILYNAKYIYMCISRKRAGSLFCAYCRSILKRRLHLEWPCTPSRIRRDLTDSFPFIIDVYRNDKAVASILPLLHVLTRIDFINCSSRHIPARTPSRLTLIAFFTSSLLILMRSRYKSRHWFAYKFSWKINKKFYRY